MSVIDGFETEVDLPLGIYEGLAGFRLAMRRFLAFSEAALADAQVTSQQYQAMLVVKTGPAGRIRIRELAEQMLMPHNAAVQLVDRLSAAGFVERTPSERDKRSVLVSLTVKGEQVLQMLARIHVGGMLANEPLLADSLARLRNLALLT